VFEVAGEMENVASKNIALFINNVLIVYQSRVAKICNSREKSLTPGSY